MGGVALPFSFSEFNWRLIILMIAVSAVVSYVGDVVGMKIGKKRISLLGLRPRYTSTVITILTGVAIAVVTLGAAAITSEALRVSLYGQNWLQREISKLTLESRVKQEQLDENQAKLDVMEFDLLQNQQRLEGFEQNLLAASRDLQGTREKLSEAERQTRKAEEDRKGLLTQLESLNAERTNLEKSIAGLRKESEQLKSGLTEMREGRMLVSQGELLAQVTILGGSSKAEIEAALARLAQQAEEMVALKQQDRRTGVPSVRVAIEEDSKKRTVSRLASTAGLKVLRLTAASNIVQGQVVSGVVQIFDRKLVFQKGAVLSKVTVTGGMKPEQAADMLYTFLKQINTKVVERGVLRDPISGAVGNLDSLEFYNIADRMSETKGNLTITFLAATDIYTEGPVNVKIEIEEKK